MEREDEAMVDVAQDVEEEINNEAMNIEQVEVAVENVAEGAQNNNNNENNENNNNGGDNVWELEDMNEMEMVRELMRSTESEYYLRGGWGEWKYEGDLIWREWEMNPYYYWNGHQQEDEEDWVVHDLWVFDDHIPNHNNGGGGGGGGGGDDNSSNTRAPALP